MSLRDEHLRQALRHAPDQDLAPSSKARESVLDYAANAVKPKPASWLKRCLNAFENWHVKSWQVAGMGALASVLLVIVMVREQAPEESIWLKPETKDLAQNKVESYAANTPEQNKLEAPAPAEDLQAKAKRSLPARETATKELAEKAEADIAEPELADKNDVAVAAAKAPEAAVVAPAPQTEDRRALSRTAPASAPTASGMAADEDSIEVKLSKTLTKQGGEAVAKKDIEAGNLRMLKIETQGCLEPTKHESSFDAVTNYKVVVIDVCITEEKPSIELLQKEVGAYNQTMLQWYQTHKD